MEITLAKYIVMFGANDSIKATIDGIEMIVPLDPANTEYAEMMRQVDAGELTIEEAD
jgi:hypothetical protein